MGKFTIIEYLMIIPYYWYAVHLFWYYKYEVCFLKLP